MCREVMDLVLKQIKRLRRLRTVTYAGILGEGEVAVLVRAEQDPFINVWPVFEKVAL